MQVTGADGKSAQLHVPEGLQMFGRVTLFPGSHFEWGCDYEMKIGDLSTIIGDFSFALQCDPLEMKVAGVSIFKIQASTYGKYKQTDANTNSCPDGFKAMTKHECRAWAARATFGGKKTLSAPFDGKWASKPKGCHTPSISMSRHVQCICA